MMSSLVSDEEWIQLAFPSGEGGSRRLTDEEDEIMLHVIQCIKTQSFVTFLLGHAPVTFTMLHVWCNGRIWDQPLILRKNVRKK